MENNILQTPITVGSFKQKANWFLVGFVFGCIFIITILLYIMQKAEATGEDISSVTRYDSQISY
jgi:hypothetical protein